MALTAYCKKCGREVEPGEICPRCGTRLGKNAAHAAWCVERTPVKDWMYWNSVMRVLLPAALVILVLVLVLEAVSGGIAAVERMMTSGFPLTLLILLAAALLAVFAVLLLQGKELSDFVVDSRGIHETRYLPDPTPLKLLMRMKSPAAAKQAEGGDTRVLMLSRRDLAWKDVARVQLWPEKCMILFYAPAWWLRIPTICTPFSWDDTIGFAQEKLGKKKKVKLPPSMAQDAPAARRSAVREPAVEQIRMDEMEPAWADSFAEPAPPEGEIPPADFAEEEPKA
ncbi:zinc ribbon domain-containing protein [Clostridiales bacterium]|nr:zinc ribbon domain-containing protein [Clostridiales bacterium]